MNNLFLYDFDDYRNETASLTPINQDPNHVGRNLYQYEQLGDNDTDGQLQKEQELGDAVLCHVPIFLKYALMDNGKYDVNNTALGYGGSAGAILAMHHWNNGNGIVVKDIEGINERCPLRFTTEVFDTQASPITAIRLLTDIITRSPLSSSGAAEPKMKPQPCAIMGTLYSDVSEKFATNTGVFDLLQVAPGASSEELQNKKQYPLFARTHPSDGGSARLLPEYLHDVMGVTKIVIVYVNNNYGEAYYKIVQDYAKSKGITLLSVPIPSYPMATKDEIKELLKIVLKSQMNYIIGVFFSEDYDTIMEAAEEVGVAGPGKFWLFCGGLVSHLYDKAQTFKRGSALAKATFGNAVITDGGGAPGMEEYELFVKEWKKLGDNSDVLNYVNSKQPFSSEGWQFNQSQSFFHLPPNHISIYSYEAIIGMGLSACEAAKKHNSKFIFTGEEHHDAFLDIDFISASGKVSIDKDSNSRDGSSTYYVVANIVETESSTDDTTVTLQGLDHFYFNALNATWEEFEHSKRFIYSDGTTNKPHQIFDVDEDMNLISPGIRAFSLTLCSLSLTLSIGFIIYTVRMRKNPAIQMSQPIFLIMVCVGAIFMSASIITLSMDEGVGTIGLTVSCSLTPWFISIGFVIIFAALFSKLWRLNQIIDASTQYRRVTITTKDVLVPFFVLLSTNMIILTVWMIISPIKWKRTILEKNEYDQVISSEGSCIGENYWVYVLVLSILNGAAILLACSQAYHARNVQTDLNEGKYIGVAMICIFQSFFVGIPILIIGHSDTSTSLSLYSSIIFVICAATLIFSFLPSILNQAANNGPRLGVRGFSAARLMRLRARLRNQNRNQPVTSNHPSSRREQV